MVNKNGNLENGYIEAWDDVFAYADNLKCNWLISKEIFNNRILPKAIENPELYAEWIDNMVETSGKKIKRPGTLKKALRILRRIKIAKRRGERILRTTLVELFTSGIEEPDCAKTALNKVGYAH